MELLTNLPVSEMVSLSARAAYSTSAASALNGMTFTVALIVAAYSLVQCYFGYIIFRVMLVIQGVITGLGVGALIGSGIALASGSFDNGLVIIAIAAVICGIVGGIMAHFLYKFGVFMYYFLIFGLIGMAIGLAASRGDNTVGLVVGLIAGVIAGIVGVILDRYIIIGTTAICFGLAAGASIGAMTSVLWLGAVLGIAFAATGMVVQIQMTKKKPKNNNVVYQVVPGQPAVQQPITVQYQQPAPASILCTNCGAPLDSTAVFCDRCGQSLAAAQPVPINTYAQTAVSAAPAYYTAPAPAPVSAAEPTYYAEPSAEPAPVPAAEPAYYAEPSAEPAPVPAAEPTYYAEPAAEPTPVPAAEPAYYAEPSAEPAPVPAAEPTYYAEPSAEPVIPAQTDVALEQTNDFPAFCSSCGAKLDTPGALFCDSCGSRIEM